MSPARPFKRHILVDMTPLEPNGQNGGAGVAAKSLVKNLSALDPETRFTLLTANDSHAELAALDAENVQRRCVLTRRTSPRLARELLDRLLPPAARVRVKSAYRRMRTARSQARVVENLRPDLLFCPFTIPTFWQPEVPCVSIVYDLQHLAYPEFFTPEQRLNRERHIEQALAHSDRVVCISEYVRQTLLASTASRGERAVTILLGLLTEAPGCDPNVLDMLGVVPGRFLLYPANFWPHKNHRRLFQALRIFRGMHPESPLKLVCTGVPNTVMQTLAVEAPRELVVFAGYLTDSQLAALRDVCAAVIFPSLYEGFGMPVLEAMTCGKPVLCSNVTSLPEVAGDAAVYFDPMDVSEIADAIAALDDRPRIDELVSRGRHRAARFGTGREMAGRYIEQFDEVLAKPARA